MLPLHPADRAVVDQLATRLSITPNAVLDRLTHTTAAPVRTRLVDGRFVELDLTPMAPDLAGPSSKTWSLDLSHLDALTQVRVDGIGLGVLTVPAGLTGLFASENHLRQLDVAHLQHLVELDVDANDLMVLEVYSPVLRHLSARGNAITCIALQSPVLQRLDLGRNQLMVLDLGMCPGLTHLELHRNALVRLSLQAPNLRSIDLHTNQLVHLDLEDSAHLRRLDASHNRLATVRVERARRLRDVVLHHNYLEALDLRGLAELQTVDASHNQLEAVHLDDALSLATLILHHNRLQQLDVKGALELRRLDVGHTPLQSLDVSGCTELVSLAAPSTELVDLDVTRCTRLSRIDVSKTPLSTVRLPETHALCEFLATTPLDLGVHERLRQPTPSTLPSELETLTRWQLHRFAATYDGLDRTQSLARLVDDVEHCSVGTAVLVYWTTRPGPYLRFDEREDVPAYALSGWDLLKTIEDHVRNRRYAHDDIFFDPRHDQQTIDPEGFDWVASHEEGHRAPAFLTRARGSATPLQTPATPV